MAKTMIRSKRIKGNTLDKGLLESMCEQIYIFNKIMRYTYNLLFDMKYFGKTISEKSVYLHLKAKYPVASVYYLNSAINEAKAKLASQLELIKLRVEEKEAKIKSVENKINIEKSKLDNYKSLKTQFVNRSRVIKNGKKPGKFTAYKGSNIYANKKDDSTLLIRKGSIKKGSVEPISYTEAEVYNQTRIKKTKSKIGNLTFKLNRLQEELKDLTLQSDGSKPPKKICFGSKAFFKTRETTDIDADEWKKEFDYKRNHAMLISGKSEGGFGNFVFKYDIENESINFMTYDKKKFVIPKVTFPHGGDALIAELNNKNRGPIAYELSMHYDKNNELYFIVKAILTLPEKDNIYFTPHVGVVSIDINPDRIDMVELNGYGCMVNREVFKMDLTNKTTNQVTNILNNISAKIISYCAKVDKPLVMEDLSLEAAKQKLMYQDKGYKKILTTFAYKHIMSSLESRAYKQSVYIKKINPAFTSILAKTKYMRKMRLPIHTVAAMVIGRRGMGFEENIPSIYTEAIDFSACKNKFAEYSKLNSATKKVPINCFYKKITNLKEFVKENKLAF